MSAALLSPRAARRARTYYVELDRDLRYRNRGSGGQVVRVQIGGALALFVLAAVSARWPRSLLPAIVDRAQGSLDRLRRKRIAQIEDQLDGWS